MSRPDADVAIIGGGPAGAAAAIVLARDGHRVVVLEKERFPRFHVGESLLPCQRPVLERLGLSDRIAAEGFLPKTAARFFSRDGSVSNGIDFVEYLEPPHQIAWEVERATFDALLLDHARDGGAEVRQGVRVGRVDLDPAVQTLHVRGDDGASETVTARWVLDATGQDSLLARQLRLRVLDPELRKVALFSHFVGAARQEGRHEGDIRLVMGDGCWYWYIPLRDDTVSIGCVTNTERFKASGLGAEDYYHDRLDDSGFLREALASATRCRDVHSLSDFSYTSERFAGDGWALLGDAASFLDPIFSTGVMLAMQSGEHAARLLSPRLATSGPATARHLDGYEKAMRRWTGAYFELIRMFYHPGFPPVFFTHRPRYQKAMAPFFAGEVRLTLTQRLYLRLFYFIIRANHRWHFIEDPRPEAERAYHG